MPFRRTHLGNSLDDAILRLKGFAKVLAQLANATISRVQVIRPFAWLILQCSGRSSGRSYWKGTHEKTLGEKTGHARDKISPEPSRSPCRASSSIMVVAYLMVVATKQDRSWGQLSVGSQCGLGKDCRASLLCLENQTFGFVKSVKSVVPSSSLTLIQESDLPLPLTLGKPWAMLSWPFGPKARLQLDPSLRNCRSNNLNRVFEANL
jgi:hypothetical protein